MSHMVIYHGTDGKPVYHEVDELVAAVTFVEHLRNSEGVENARICRMEDVNFEFRPYFRVQVGSPAPAPMPAPFPPAPETAPQDGGNGAQADRAVDSDVDAMWSASIDGDHAATDGTADSEPVASGTVRRGLFGR